MTILVVRADHGGDCFTRLRGFAIAILCFLISIYYRNHEERPRRDVVIPCKHWHPCASSSSRGASQMRRGDLLTPQVRQTVCKWIASAYRRRNDDSFFPLCQPTPRLPRRIASASQFRFYVSAATPTECKSATSRSGVVKRNAAKPNFAAVSTLGAESSINTHSFAFNP